MSSRQAPELVSGQRESWPPRWRQEVEGWQAQYQVTVECCQRRWEIEWGLGLVGGQQRWPQEIANLVEWVVGDADEWMTGQTLVSDGGSSLGWT